MMRTSPVLFLLSVTLVLSSCGFARESENDPKAQTSVATVNWALSGRLDRVPEIRTEIDNVFSTPAPECRGADYLSKAKTVVAELLPKNVPVFARPSDVVLANECLVRAAVKTGDCSSVEKSRSSDCESLLVMKKAVSANAEPLMKASDAEIYVRYYLDAKAYPPQEYLR